ncbi:MAG: thiamine ABC transporter substrate-binding protein [Thermanaerothrix sp.]|uniref:Thiamine ABC transporter substrate-binding protein n=1 Tax=Thermanaerothrix solaris TaxID=3058434 RepID=A0ABU3NP00_9CHLR|nr:thiamine ABC transporter substrate-binding protein [Thermanaerothrix sp. 4228-RoL]MDT8898565.1 thiamine ABC transporter substrate-binding protein [Thermanaerothrix sp. 4228-RoL]
MKALMSRLVVLFMLALILVACAPAVPTTPTATPAATATIGPVEPTAPPAASPTPAAPTELRIMTHDSFAASEEVIAEFERQYNVKLVILPSGDTGAMLSQAILTKNAPLADVLYGVDNTFLSRALKEDLFEPYRSPLLENIPPEFILDPEYRVLPVDYGDVCINYDKRYFAERNLPVPQSLEDLLKPEYKGLLVVENPATSSPGLAFLMATIAHFGDPGYLDFWKGLRENGVVVVNDWETAYYTNFSGSSGKGPQPMVVSYGSSPPAEVIFAEQPLDEAPTASIVAPDTCFRQIEFVGILKGTSQRALAEKWVDYMLDRRFQEDMPLQMFVFPVNRQAQLPEAFVKYAQIPEKPATLDPNLIAEKREAWIEAWTETVLR